jgi:IMP dehydrogenase
VIKDPITVPPDMSVREVIALTQQRRISGLPVVEGRRVVGIVTNRDLRFETNLDQAVRNVMTPQQRLITVKEGSDLDTRRR